jgi:putative transposase
MPWRETCQMDERTQFIARVLAGEDEMTALCCEYGISRKTGYKWLGRSL